MYLFEFETSNIHENVFYPPKAKQELSICGHVTTAFFATIILGFQNIKEIIVFLLLKVQTNTIFATMEFEHLNKSN